MPAARHVRRFLLVALTAVLAAACTTPTSRPNPNQLAARDRPAASASQCKPKPVKATFHYARRLPASDRGLVRTISRQAISYFRLRTLNCVRRDPVDVHMFAIDNGDVVARADYGEIEVFTKSPAWGTMTRGDRAAVLFHEWYHVLQRTLSSAPPPPTWFFEGSAEWAGFEAAVHFGYFDSMESIQQMTRYDARRPPAPLTKAKPENPGVYSLYFTSLDFLVSRYGGKKRLQQFWQRYNPGESWKTVFRSVFKVKVSSFLKEFEAHREAGFTN